MRVKQSLDKIFFLIKKIEDIKSWLFILILGSVFSSLCGLGIGHGLRTLIQKVASGDWEQAQRGLFIFVFSIILDNVYKIVNPLLITKFHQETRIKIRKQVLRHNFQEEEFDGYSNQGNYLELLIGDSEKVTALLVKITNSFIEYPISAISTIIYLIWSSNVLLLLLGSFVSVMCWFVSEKLNSHLYETSRKERDLLGNLNQFVKETFTNLEFWHVYDDVYCWIKNKNAKMHEELIDVRMKKEKILNLTNIFQTEFSDTFARLLIMSVGGILAFQGKADSGDIVAFIFLFHRVVKPFQYIFNFMNQLNSQIGSVEKILELYKATTEKTLNHGSLMEIKDIERLQIKNFELVMKEHSLFTIKDLSFTKGTITCICGKNGTGKTTFLNTLLGHHKQFSGELYLNNQLLSNDLLNSYRNLYSVMDQEAYVFSESFKENITLGDSIKDFDRFNDIIEITGLMKIANKFPGGLQHRINNDLSSGQKKIVSLCRTLYQQAPIIILDEPTESLDQEHRKLLKNYLARIQHNYIIIIISHNQEMINFADQVFWIKEGQMSGGVPCENAI